MFCEACLLMTSTLCGLQSLASEQGYAHTANVERDEGGERVIRCPCCVVLIGKDYAALSVRARGTMRLFGKRQVPLAEDPDQSSRTRPRPGSYPFLPGNALSHIQVTNRENVIVSTVIVFTESGEVMRINEEHDSTH